MHGKSAPIERQPFPFPYSLFTGINLVCGLSVTGLLFPIVTEIHRIDSRASRLPSPQRTAPDKIVVVKHCRYDTIFLTSLPSPPLPFFCLCLSSFLASLRLDPSLASPSDFSNLLPPLLPPLLLHIYHAHPPLPPSISFLILFISFFFFPTFRPGTSFSSHFPFPFSLLYLHSFSFSHQSPPLCIAIFSLSPS